MALAERHSATTGAPPVRGVPESLGNYRILKRLAWGGMAELFLGRSEGVEGFQKFAAIKRMLPNLAEDPQFVTMFLDEARLAARLDHQNIVQAYDFGQSDDSYYLAMEYLHGVDVKEVLKTALIVGKRISIKHALTIVTRVAAALEYAHRKEDVDGAPLHIVHRDVAPSNIIVTYDGAVKLADFGIARADSNVNHTEAGLIKGKLSYLSPEQCLGEDIDGRSDVFSLGIVLYELTTMSRLFPIKRNDKLEVLTRIAAGKIPRPSRRVHVYPPTLEKIVMRALHPMPARRYQTANELLHDLESFARKQQYTLSPAELGRFVRKLTGNRPEPWRTSGDDGDDVVRRDGDDSSVWHRLGVKPLSDSDAVAAAPMVAARESASLEPAGSGGIPWSKDRSDNTLYVVPFSSQRRYRAVLWAAVGIAVMLLAGLVSYHAYDPDASSMAHGPDAVPAEPEPIIDSKDADAEQDATARRRDRAKSTATPIAKRDRKGTATRAREASGKPARQAAGAPEPTSRARKPKPARRRASGAAAAKRGETRAAKSSARGRSGRARKPAWDPDDAFPPSARRR